MENKRKSYVYKITCNITGEYYFGSSFSAKRDSYWGSGKLIKERIRQYGKENFTKEILHEFDDRVEAHKKENEYIEQYINDELCLNMHLFDNSKAFSEDSIKKISDANKNKIVSEETRQKMSIWQKGNKSYWYGKHLSEETKHKIGIASKKRTGENASFYGRHHSAESKKKISLSSQGEHNGMFGHKHTIFSINKIKKRWELVKSGKRYHKGYTEKHFPELVDILKNQKLDC